MLKSIAVVVGSYVLSVALVLGTDPLLSRLFPGDFVNGHIPSNVPLIVSTALFVVISIFCAWVCARFAPGNAGRTVLWFLVLGEVLGAAATIANWNKGYPHWYLLSWLLAWPISCWIGLAISGRRNDKASAAAA